MVIVCKLKFTLLCYLQIMCSCGMTSSKTEDVWDLQLPIENSDTLIGALQAYLVSMVPDFRCENCGNEGIVQKIELDRLQPVVTFHLKRFDSLNNKINKHVSFPPLLDLLPFAPRKVTFFTSIDKVSFYFSLLIPKNKRMVFLLFWCLFLSFNVFFAGFADADILRALCYYSA